MRPLHNLEDPALGLTWEKSPYWYRIFDVVCGVFRTPFVCVKFAICTNFANVWRVLVIVRLPKVDAVSVRHVVTSCAFRDSHALC